MLIELHSDCRQGGHVYSKLNYCVHGSKWIMYSQTSFENNTGIYRITFNYHVAALLSGVHACLSRWKSGSIPKCPYNNELSSSFINLLFWFCVGD